MAGQVSDSQFLLSKRVAFTGKLAGHTRELTGEGHPFAEKELTIGDLPGHRLFLPEELIEDNCKLQNADLKFAFAICNSLPPLVCFVLALTHLSADYINKSTGLLQH